MVIMILKRLSSFLSAVLIAAGLVFTPAYAESAAEITQTLSASSVAAPVPDQEPGYHLMDSGTLKVALTSKTKGTDIYYKIDDGSYKKYSKPVSITKNCTLYTYAKADGVKSSVAEYEYQLGTNFKLSTYGGDFTENQSITVTTDVPGVTFYYTLDGTDPDTSSNKVLSGGIKIENTASVSILAFKDGWYTTGFYNLEFNINKLGTYRYFYNKLSAKEKTAYDRVYKALHSGAGTVDISDLKIGFSGSGLLTAISEITPGAYYDFKASSWLTTYIFPEFDQYSNFNINYDVNSSAAKTAQRELEKAAAKVVAEAKKQPTAYDKLKYIHDWIVDNTDYLSYNETDDRSLYANAPIVKGFGNCGGYARAFQYLALSLGFDCLYIEGDVYYTDGSLIGYHAWNKVKLDGKWYNVDVCWDDQSFNGNYTIYYNCFLRGDSNFTDHVPSNDYSRLSLPSCAKDYDPAANYDPSSEITLAKPVIKVKSKTKTAVTLSWSKAANADGYQLQIYKGGKWVSYKLKSNTTSYTIKSLSSATKYKIRIRAFKKANGETIYSPFSNGTVMTK